MTIPSNFIFGVASSYLEEKITRDEAINSLMRVLEIREKGAEEILDGAVDDIKFFYGITK